MVLLSNTYYILGFAVNGINNVNISSYERRYLLSSRNSGLVASFYDIAAGITVSNFTYIINTYIIYTIVLFSICIRLLVFNQLLIISTL